MSFTFVQLLSYSIAISAVISLIRFKQLDRAYHPFIFFLWGGTINEAVTYFAIRFYKTNAINCNIYILVSSLLLLWAFYSWGIFERNKKLPFFLLLFLTGAWIFDNFIGGSIHLFNPYFRILYSFITVLLSINLLNRLIVEHHPRILTNPLFLICISFIIFFTYKALIEIFWLYGLTSSTSFRLNIYRLMTYINLTVNIIYAIVVLWIPRKQEYTAL